MLSSILDKGSPLRTPLYCPGVWLNGNKNSLKVTVNTFKEIDETLEVTNLPLRKWFHLAIYVNQIDELKVLNTEKSQNYQKIVSTIVNKNNGLYFNNEIFVIQKK